MYNYNANTSCDLGEALLLLYLDIYFNSHGHCNDTLYLLLMDSVKINTWSLLLLNFVIA